MYLVVLFLNLLRLVTCRLGREPVYIDLVDKPTEQSSTRNSYSASFAVDGNKNCVYSRGAGTKKEKNPWWRVDLLSSYKIKSLTITASHCCPIDSRLDINIVDDSQSDVKLCASLEKRILAGGTQKISCASNSMIGKAIEIQMFGKVALTLCEVEAEGKFISSVPDIDCKNTANGIEYRGTKSTGKNGETCRKWSDPDVKRQLFKFEPMKEVFKSWPSEIQESNYCRNPSNDSRGPWCYSKKTVERVLFCDIELCGRTKADFTKCWGPLDGYYIGTKNTAETGGLCKQWKDVNVQISKKFQLTDKNYCRNLGSTVGEGVWCFVDDKLPQPCNVRSCNPLRKVLQANFNNKSNKISWRLPSGPREHFKITCPKGHLIVGPMTETATCTDLEPGSLYSILVTTEHSHFSAIQVQLKAKTELPKVTGLKVTQRTTTSLLATWTKLRGNKISYSLLCKTVTSNAPASRSTVKENRGSCTGLSPGEEYVLIVTTKKRGWHEPSQELKDKTTKTRLDKVTQLEIVRKTETTIEVKWQFARGNLDKYILTCTATKDNSQKHSKETTKTTALCTELEPDTSFKIEVLTVKAGFDSVVSDFVIENTLFDLGTVSHVVVSQQTNSSLVVSWTPPRGTGLSYTVSCKPNGSDSGPLQDIAPPLTTATCKGLTPGTWYTVNVIVAKAGYGNQVASHRDATTKTKLNAVSGITVSNQTNTSLVVSWKPLRGNGLSYTLNCKPDGKASDTPDAAISTTTATCRRLTPGTWYTVIIGTAKPGWDKEYASLHDSSTKTKLNAVSDITVSQRTGTSLVVSWKPPRGNGLSYTIKCKPDGSDRGILQNIAPSMTTATCRQLIPGTWYTVAISITKAGWDEESVSLRDGSTKTRLIAVSNIVVSQRTSTSLTVAWTPARGFGLSYTVSCRPDGNDSETVVDVAPSLTLATCQKLTPGTLFTVTITTMKAHWEKVSASIYDNTTKTDLDTIKELKFTSRTSSSLSVSWGHADGMKEGYNVTCDSIQGDTTSTQFLLTTALSAEFTNLPPATEHVVTVATMLKGWTEVFKSVTAKTRMLVTLPMARTTSSMSTVAEEPTSKRAVQNSSMCQKHKGIRLCPSVEVICVRNCMNTRREFIREDRTTQLVASCNNCVHYKIISYDWQVSFGRAKASPFNTLNLNDGERSNPVLELMPGILKSDYVYTFSVNVLVGDIKVSNYYSAVARNAKLMAGECIIKPGKGNEIFIDFVITCTRFKSNSDGESELQYIFYSANDLTNDDQVMFIGESRKPSFSGKFPFTAGTRNYVRVVAKDSHGSRVVKDTDFPLPKIKNEFDFAKFLVDLIKPNGNSLKKLEKLLSTGNVTEVVQVIDYSSWFLNLDSHLISEFERNRIRDYLIETLDKLPVSTLPREHATSALWKLTSASQISKDSGATAAKVLNKLVSSFKKTKAVDVEREESEYKSRDFLQIAGNIVEGAQRALRVVGNKHIDAQDSRKFAKAMLKAVDNIATTFLKEKMPGETPTRVVTQCVGIHMDLKKAAYIGNNVSFDSGTLQIAGGNAMIIEQYGGEFEVATKSVWFRENPFTLPSTSSNLTTGILSVQYISASSMTELHLKSRNKNDSLIEYEHDLHVEENSAMSRINYSIRAACKKLSERNPWEIIKTRLKIERGGIIRLRFLNVKEISFNVHIVAKQDDEFEIVNKTLKKSDNFTVSIFSKNISHAKHDDNDEYESFSLQILPIYDNSDSRCQEIKDVTTVGASDQMVSIDVEVWSLTCLYWDDRIDDWSSDGCKPSQKTTTKTLICVCNHLTVFSGRLLRMPNVLYFEKTLALFTTIDKNPVTLIVVCFVWAMYLLTVPFARYLDKKCEKIVFVSFLEDNEPSDTYAYLVILLTGWQKESQTTANVYITLVGHRGVGMAHHLTRNGSQFIPRGTESAYILMNSKPLGSLIKVRIWHDNSGNSPMWYLHQIFVKDLQTREVWYFLCNNWLASDRGDAATMRELSVATDEEMTRFKNIYPVHMRRGIHDDHLWYSVFSRPPESHFTSVQRLSCAFMLMFTTMAADIIFFQLPSELVEDANDISWQELLTKWWLVLLGFNTNVVVLPVDIAMISMFRCIKPRHSSIRFLEIPYNNDTTEFVDDLTTSENVSENRTLAETSVISDFSSSSARTTDVNVNLNNNPDTTTGCDDGIDHTSHESSNRVDTPTNSTDVTSGNRNVQWKMTEPQIHQGPGTIAREKCLNCGLPWWTIFIAWGLLCTICVASTFFTILYGLQYGYRISLEWLTAFILGLFFSVFCIEPMKTFLVILGMTLLFRKPVAFSNRSL